MSTNTVPTNARPSGRVRSTTRQAALRRLEGERATRERAAMRHELLDVEGPSGVPVRAITCRGCVLAVECGRSAA